MADHQHGHAVLGQADHHLQHLLDHLRVKGRGGFVKEHNVRFHAQAAGDGHPLLLPSRELPGKLLGLFGDAHLLQVIHGGLFRLFLRRLAHPYRPQGEVLEDGQVRKEVEVLEDHAHLGANLFDILEIVGEFDAVDDDASALVLLEPVDTAYQRRFARTGGAANDDTLAALHREADVFQDMKLPVPFVHVFDGDDRAAVGLLSCWLGWSSVYPESFGSHGEKKGSMAGVQFLLELSAVIGHGKQQRK
jgi:hypothetical protein